MRSQLLLLMSGYNIIVFKEFATTVGVKPAQSVLKWTDLRPLFVSD